MLHDPVMEFYEVLKARSIRDPASGLPKISLLGRWVNKERRGGRAETLAAPALN
jgi:hypothetical protein